MDNLKTKRKLYAGLGDFARQMRGEELRKKYSTGIPAMDKSQQDMDEAVDAAQLPSEASIAGKVAAKKLDASDVVSDADAQNEKLMAEMAEDEEMQKWMAKQKG